MYLFDNNIFPWSSSSGNEELNILLSIAQADFSSSETSGDRENKIMRGLIADKKKKGINVH